MGGLTRREHASLLACTLATRSQEESLRVGLEKHWELLAGKLRTHVPRAWAIGCQAIILLSEWARGGGVRRCRSLKCRLSFFVPSDTLSTFLASSRLDLYFLPASASAEATP